MMSNDEEDAAEFNSFTTYLVSDLNLDEVSANMGNDQELGLNDMDIIVNEEQMAIINDLSDNDTIMRDEENQKASRIDSIQGLYEGSARKRKKKGDCHSSNSSSSDDDSGEQSDDKYKDDKDNRKEYDQNENEDGKDEDDGTENIEQSNGNDKNDEDNRDEDEESEDEDDDEDEEDEDNRDEDEESEDEDDDEDEEDESEDEDEDDENEYVIDNSGSGEDVSERELSLPLDRNKRVKGKAVEPYHCHRKLRRNMAAQGLYENRDVTELTTIVATSPRLKAVLEENLPQWKPSLPLLVRLCYFDFKN